MKSTDAAVRAAAIARWEGKVFNLPNRDGDFFVVPEACYMGAAGPMLYTGWSRPDGTILHYAKGTEAELRRNAYNIRPAISGR